MVFQDNIISSCPRRPGCISKNVVFRGRESFYILMKDYKTFFFFRITCSNALYTIKAWLFVNEVKMGYFWFDMVCLHSKVFLFVNVCTYTVILRWHWRMLGEFISMNLCIWAYLERMRCFCSCVCLLGLLGFFIVRVRGVVLACVVLGQGVERGVGWMVMRLNSLGSVVIRVHLAAAPSAFRWLAQPHLSKELLNNLVLPNPHQPCWETETGPKRETANTVRDTFFLYTHIQEETSTYYSTVHAYVAICGYTCSASMWILLLWK